MYFTLKSSLLAQLVGQKTFFANVSIGYAHGMYYLSSSGLECKVKHKRTIDAKIASQNESYVNAKIIANRKRKTDRLAEREKQ